jgi:hypothetical protein
MLLLELNVQRRFYESDESEPNLETAGSSPHLYVSLRLIRSIFLIQRNFVTFF